MPSRTEIVEQFLAAQKTRDAAAIDALRPHLVDDAVFSNPRTSFTGADTILEHLKTPPAAAGPMVAMMAQLEIDPPVEEGDVVSVFIKVPEGSPMPVKGLTYSFDFNGEQITKIGMQPQM